MAQFNDSMLHNAKKLHFVGIGGSGMCPLAEILHSKGYIITGSDVNEGDTIDRIRSLGIKVFMGHKAENVGDADILVHTAAVHEDNPELQYAKQHGIPVIERSILLGMVSRKFPNTIAVSGTHGKTTTTSMISQIMIYAGIDPTIIIGGKLPLIESNGRGGKSDIMVCEACEYVDTFLQLTPAVSVILNIDADHLDYFGTLENIIKSFRQFATQTTSTLIVNGDDDNSMKAVNGLNKEIITFGLNNRNSYYAENICVANGSYFNYDLMSGGKKLCHIELGVPGKHNILNSLGAAAACLNAGVSSSDIEKYIKTFRGAGRRFEIYGDFKGVTLADDYAHHPHEITATLDAARHLTKNKLWAIFQPFTFSRTKTWLNEFAQSLSVADHVILAEIMGSRETNIYNVHSSDIAAKLNNAVCIDAFEDIADYIVKNAQPGDFVITMGGGDIYKAAKLIRQKYLSLNA